MLIAIRLCLFCTLLLGVIYPVGMCTLGSLAFPRQAKGDREWVGENFDQPGQFWGRPSATAEKPYNLASSSGSNLGPKEPKLAEALQTAEVKYGPQAPRDLVTASASGLDPHITPQAALFQVERVARERHKPPAMIEDLVSKHIEGGLLGHPRVHVARLNQALEKL
jgi:K+-transporting ATPase ATPase C chain